MAALELSCHNGCSYIAACTLLGHGCKSQHLPQYHYNTSSCAHSDTTIEYLAADAKTCSCLSPPQKSCPFSLGVFQVWLPITSRGELVVHPSSAAWSGSKAPLRCTNFL